MLSLSLLNVSRHHPLSFLQRAQPYLEEAEAENNMPLAIALDLGTGGVTLSAAPVLVTMEDAGQLVGVAVRSPPRSLVLTRAPEPALAALAQSLKGARVALPGVVGPSAEAEYFARLWAGIACELVTRMTLYSCEAVAALAPVAGRLRIAERRDAPLLQAWTSAFQAEIHEPWDEQHVRSFVLQQLADHRLFLWVDGADEGAPAAMTALQGATRRGIRLTHVFTPPELRGRGYATSCVAAVTTRILESGRDFCVLYADAANPASNALYRRVGYQALCDSAAWRLF